MPISKSVGKRRSVRLRAFAKINLCLHVLGRRPDNYHELRTIFQTISLHDTLDISITPGSSGFDMFMKSTEPALPLDREDLVMRAIEAISPEVGFRGRVHVHLDKKI